MGNSPEMLYSFAVVFTFLPTIAVILRFYARRKKRTPLQWDDWLVVFALLACVATNALMILHVAIGMLGQHIKMSNGKPVYDAEFYMFQRFLFANDITQLLAIGPTKVSVLLFYRRIFRGSRAFDIISYTLIALAISWTVTFFLTNLLQFRPIEGWWTQPPNGKVPKLDLTKMYLAQSYADVGLDVCIIALPVPLIWKQMCLSIGKKIGVSFVFLLGSLTTAASVARTAVQYGVVEEYESRNPDRTYFLTPIIYWPVIEASLGITAACLPLLRPIVPPIKNFIIRSKKSLATLVGVSNKSSRESDRTSEMEAEMPPLPATVNEKPAQGDRWLQAYHMSILDESVNREGPEDDYRVHEVRVEQV